MSIPWPPDIAEWNEEEGDEERCVNDGRIAREVAAGSRRACKLSGTGYRLQGKDEKQA
jgi:hypothetical protein